VTTVLVDAANVVGSRPDGWWRDRAGATSRLLVRLPALVGRELLVPGAGCRRCTAVVAVVEGRARDVADVVGVTVVRARGSGDDDVVAVAEDVLAVGQAVLVVTADRGLRARLPEAAAVAGPGWLLDLLAEDPDGLPAT
jgi:hypothetical protein